MSTDQSEFPDEQGESGEFERQEDAFRNWVSDEDSSAFGLGSGRYHLYVSLACPWAHRTLIVRSLKGLDSVIGVTVVDPIRDEKGWAFREGPGHSKDPVNGFSFLSEAYKASDPDFSGRVTVPVLWDRKTARIVNNSEDDICRMFNGVFAQLGRGGPNLFPKHLEAEHGRLCDQIYETINNGVYRAGFATRQEAYSRAATDLFDALDQMEARLGKNRYLLGDSFVEADWRLFCTLIRFDAVYHGHFKCNLQRILDYPNLSGFLRDLYQHPGIRETVDFDHIKRHYYVTHTAINPTRIVPIGPELNLMAPHGRG